MNERNLEGRTLNKADISFFLKQKNSLEADRPGLVRCLRGY